MNDTVDLYGYFGADRAGAQGGSLLCRVPMALTLPNWRRRRPAVLILPGGGYHHTSDREAEPVALRFAAAGYAAFVLHYSCAPSRFPTALREAAMAMRYIRENADAFGIDPGMVGALGFSAGGHLCGCLGTMYDTDAVSDLGGPELLRPDGLCLCYPVTVSWGGPIKEALKISAAQMKRCGSGFPWKNWCGRICRRCSSGIPAPTAPCPAWAA